MNYEFKGSQGIWVAYPNSQYWCVSLKNQFKDTDKTALSVSVMLYKNDPIESFNLSEESAANAILISKAPDLLEELKHCVAALEVFDTYGTRLITNRVKQLLKDATTLPNE